MLARTDATTNSGSGAYWGYSTRTIQRPSDKYLTGDVGHNSAGVLAPRACNVYGSYLTSSKPAAKSRRGTSGQPLTVGHHGLCDGHTRPSGRDRTARVTRSSARTSTSSVQRPEWARAFPLIPVLSWAPRAPKAPGLEFVACSSRGPIARDGARRSQCGLPRKRYGRQTRLGAAGLSSILNACDAPTWLIPPEVDLVVVRDIVPAAAGGHRRVRDPGHPASRSAALRHPVPPGALRRCSPRRQDTPGQFLRLAPRCADSAEGTPPRAALKRRGAPRAVPIPRRRVACTVRSGSRGTGLVEAPRSLQLFSAGPTRIIHPSHGLPGPSRRRVRSGGQALAAMPARGGGVFPDAGDHRVALLTQGDRSEGSRSGSAWTHTGTADGAFTRRGSPMNEATACAGTVACGR